MARTIKYSKEDILEKSVDFIKEHGYSKLTARELAKYIGCSTGPIFKNYENFDMYKEDLKFYLRKDYSSFIYKYVDIKDYLYSLKKVNFTISEFKKVMLFMLRKNQMHSFHYLWLILLVLEQ